MSARQPLEPAPERPARDYNRVKRYRTPQRAAAHVEHEAEQTQQTHEEQKGGGREDVHGARSEQQSAQRVHCDVDK